MLNETSDRINIQEYAEANPDSELLARMSESVRDTGYTYFEGWWDAFTAEHGAGALPADAAVSAYFSVMHPTKQLGLPETLGPANARALVAGAKVVTLTGGYEITKFKRGILPPRFFPYEFDERLSGTLAEDATAVVDYPYDWAKWFPKVALGLRFEGRDDTAITFPAADFRIGGEAIMDAYMERFVSDTESYCASLRDERVPIRHLRAAAVVHRLGLLGYDDLPGMFGYEVARQALNLAMPERPKDYGTDFIPALPYIYQLYLETTEARIRSLASADGIEEHEQLLEDAVDAIRGTSQGS